MIDPSITGRIGLAGPSGNTRAERRNGEDGVDGRLRSVEEKGESKKKEESRLTHKNVKLPLT